MLSKNRLVCGMSIKQFVILFGLSIAFPFEVYSHTVVDAQCDNSTIYKYDSESSHNNNPTFIETSQYKLKILHQSDIWDIHELEITSKSNPIQTVQLQFEGPVFEITTLELDDKAIGKEFMITDKPSARGYRYSLIPSLLGMTITNESQLSQLWSLPEHDYPMFTDLNNDQVCEVLYHNDEHISYFKYPSFMVNSIAYQYNAKVGQLKLASSTNKKHIQTQWEDEIHRYRKIILAIGNSYGKDYIDLLMYEFEIEPISATRFLYIAKQVGKFSEAIKLLKHLFLAYNDLEAEDDLSNAPFSWSIWGEISFDEFNELNNEIRLFSDDEMQDIKSIFAMMKRS